MANPLTNFDSVKIPNQVENSPMSNLAINLGSTTIGPHARRKLSLIEESPLDSAMVISPTTPHKVSRLLLSNLQFNSPVGSGTPVRKVGVPRRHLSNENFNPMSNSPVKTVSPSKFQAVRHLSTFVGRPRNPLEDHDPNSQDSGYCPSEDSKSTPSEFCFVQPNEPSEFCFVQPNGLAPRRNTNELPRLAVLSTSSDSTDDGFLDFNSLQVDQLLPPLFTDLITEPIINPCLGSESSGTFNFHHCISENNTENSAEETMDLSSISRKRSSSALDITPVSKRHKPLTESTTAQQNTLFNYGFKRIAEPRPLISHNLSMDEPLTPPPRPKFRHCLSESEAVIKSALCRSSEANLIGDFSRELALPLVPGSHQDLKSITPSTLANLINGHYADTVQSFQIIDCRYPYEFEGGHIQGAVNIYTKDHLMKEFLENKKPLPAMINNNEEKARHIIVFHCEFSAERGPGLSRFLRSKDRESNAYPALHHPELYLLEGGYKAFFNSHKELCEPCAYRKMVDADKSEMHHFRVKSKTWSGDKPQRPLKKSSSFKRLGL